MSCFFCCCLEYIQFSEKPANYYYHKYIIISIEIEFAIYSMKHLMNNPNENLKSAEFFVCFLFFFFFFSHVLVLGARDVFPGAGEDLQSEDGGDIFRCSSWSIISTVKKYIWGVPLMGVPLKWMVYKGKSPSKMDDDWGYPYFRKPNKNNYY